MKGEWICWDLNDKRRNWADGDSVATGQTLDGGVNEEGGGSGADGVNGEMGISGAGGNNGGEAGAEGVRGVADFYRG